MRWYKKDCVDIRQGNKIEKDGKLYEVVKFEHTRGMARQTGNVQMELRELSKGGGRGNKSTLRMKPGHTLEVIRLDEKRFRVLYLDGENLQVMNEATYDQVEVPMDLFDGQVQKKLVNECTFMEEPPEVTVMYFGEEALSCKLPATLELEVDRSFMGASKQSATAREKDCHVKGGMIVKVPDHVEKGDTIVVDTRDGKFVRKLQR
ncbi:elongation factor P [Chloropicon primus]|uniref:Elongation factor P n=1 Tax=Chloropicon primus TaxID=1764295 RepID=A0A5B8MW33_9CHLO|nr:elongation factor P [Chloropicon primus]UPR03945.1 elongation factor P [Chloropicon primus]|eukprot:QDZ24739.1 elongation factor P [Chloropicon primus]